MDANSNVVVAGTYSGTIELGGTERSAGGLNDMFVMSANKNSSIIAWATALKAEGFGNVSPTAMASDANTYITGRFTGKVTGDGQSSTPEGGADILLTQITNGKVQWISNFGGSGNDGGRAIALDGAGYAYVGGYFAGLASFGLAASNDLASEGGNDGFVFRVHLATDAVSWTARVGGSGADQITAIVPTASGLYAGGAHTGPVTIGATTVSAASQGVFGVSMAASGSFGTVTSFSNGKDAGVDHVAILSDGSIVMAGTFVGQLTIGANTVNGTGSGQAHFLTKIVP